MTRQNNIVEHGTVWRQTQLTMERRMRFGKSGQRNYPANNYCLGRHEPTFNRPYDCILIIERHSMYVHAGMGCSYPQRMHIFAEIRSIYSAILRLFSIPIVQPLWCNVCVFVIRLVYVKYCFNRLWVLKMDNFKYVRWKVLFTVIPCYNTSVRLNYLLHFFKKFSNSIRIFVSLFFV